MLALREPSVSGVLLVLIAACRCYCLCAIAEGSCALQQGRGGDELGAEYARGLERSMHAGLTGQGIQLF